MNKLIGLLLFLCCISPAQAESRLATAAKAASINTLFLVAGEDVTPNNSGWNHTFTDHDTSGGGVGGAMAEYTHASYDQQRLRIIISGAPHTTNATPIRHWLTEYSIPNNVATNKGDLDPTGIFDTYNAVGTRVTVTVAGTATGSLSQIGVAQDAASGSCAGTTWNIKETAGSYLVRQNLNSALSITGCIVGDTITIRGNHAGGATTANDITLTVTAVTANGINNNGHGYHLSAFVSQVNKIYRIHTNGTDNASVDLDKDFSSLSANDWTYDPLPETSGGTDRGPLEYVPERSALWHFDISDYTLKELNLAVGSTWQNLHTFDAAFSADGVSLLYSGVDKCVVLIGGGQAKVYKICIAADRTLTFPALDDFPTTPYPFFSSGAGAQCMPWIDAISGHLFVSCPTPVTFTTVAYVYELNINAGSGSQWTSRASDLVPDFNSHFLGQVGSGYWENVSSVTLWDQGVTLFMGSKDIWGWMGTANNRAGWETGDGALTFANIISLPGVISYNAFNDQSTILPAWDATDSGLTTAMTAAGYTNHTITFAAGSGNANAIRQPYGGTTGGGQFYSIPRIISDSGSSWLNLPILNHTGEGGTEFFQPLFGNFATGGTQEPIIAPNSTLGRTVWLRLDWKPSASYFSTVWRKVLYNYQISRDVNIASGSDVIEVVNITLNDGGIYAGCSFTACGGTWAQGRGMVVYDGSGFDARDMGHYVLGAPVDATHIHVFQADGVTPASWFGTATGVGIAISGAGILDGTHDSAVDSFKLGILNNTAYYKSNVSIGGTFVLLNDRPDGVYNRLTNSPNVYQYDSGIQTNGTVNDGTVPYNTSSTNTIVVRIQTTNITRTASGVPFTNTIIDWWNNGVGGPTITQTHWANGPGLWGADDGAGHKFGFSYLELVMQHTYGDPNQSFTDTNYLIKNLVISTEPIPTGAAASTPSGTSGRYPRIRR